MEGCHISRKIQLSLLHIPTWLLVIGFPVYWLELFVFKKAFGQTTPLAWFIFLILTAVAIFGKRAVISTGVSALLKDFTQASILNKLIYGVGFLLGVVILGLSFYASIFPLHLPQEFDSLNYHYTLPRQHLLLHSFAHLSWSTADLYLMPIDYALAPYWLSMSLLNKLPQYVFLIGLLSVSARLSYMLSEQNKTAAIITLWAILGSHGFAIQMGTAMLDITNCYLFLAFIHSVMTRRKWLAAIEFSFIFWAKPFLPLQIISVAVFVGLVVLVLKLFKFKCSYSLSDHTHFIKSVVPMIVILSVFIAGPFLAKSMYYAGTPLYPLAPGLIKTKALEDASYLQSLQKRAREHLDIKDNYGHGRSVTAMVKHLWLIAIPTDVVNNKFDYPLGLPWLLVVGPWFVCVFAMLKRREVSIIALTIMGFWITWWVGTQQSRFLYIPLVLMFISVFKHQNINTKVLRGCLIIAMSFVCLSLFRAHKADWGKAPMDVLRSEDQVLIKQKLLEGEEVLTLDFIDAAYARVPITVEGKDSIFVLP